MYGGGPWTGVLSAILRASLLAMEELIDYILIVGPKTAEL
jgi:hypothetical protein